MGGDKKYLIMEAAVELFSKKGFEGTSMRDLASEAGVNLAMINYYFGSKEGLLEEVLQYNASYMTNILNDIIHDDSISSIGKLDRFIDALIEKMSIKRSFHKLWHHEIMLNKEGHISNKIKQIISNNSITIKELIQQGIDKQEFRQVDIPLTISTLFGTINHIFLSRTICQVVFNKDINDTNPFDEELTDKLRAYLKGLMHTHLLIPISTDSQ